MMLGLANHPLCSSRLARKVHAFAASSGVLLWLLPVTAACLAGAACGRAGARAEVPDVRRAAGSRRGRESARVAAATSVITALEVQLGIIYEYVFLYATTISVIWSVVLASVAVSRVPLVQPAK